MQSQGFWLIPIVCVLGVFFLFLADGQLPDTFDRNAPLQIIVIALVLNHHFFRVGNRLLAGFATMCGTIAILNLFYDYSGWGKSDLWLSEAALTILVYSAMLFTTLSDFLLGGLANFLTSIRGEQWAKELDYLYLTLGAVGVLGTLNRIEALGGRMTGYDFIGPIIIASAIVIRIIKTRAEIAGWNKRPSSETLSKPF